MVWITTSGLFDISGDKMKLLLDYPTIGEPHYAQAAPADLIRNNGQLKFYKIEENNNPFVTKGEKESKVVRQGNRGNQGQYERRQSKGIS